MVKNTFKTRAEIRAYDIAYFEGMSKKNRQKHSAKERKNEEKLDVLFSEAIKSAENYRTAITKQEKEAALNEGRHILDKAKKIDEEGFDFVREDQIFCEMHDMSLSELNTKPIPSYAKSKKCLDLDGLDRRPMPHYTLLEGNQKGPSKHPSKEYVRPTGHYHIGAFSIP